MDEKAEEKVAELKDKLRAFFHQNEVDPYLAASVMVIMSSEVAVMGDVKRKVFLDGCKEAYARAMRARLKAQGEAN
jgi:hypothetical protein